MRFKKDIENLLNREGFSDSMTILTGDSAEKTVKGVFSFNYSKHSLKGRPLATSGPLFYCLKDEAKGIRTGDKMAFENKTYIVQDLKPSTREITKIEFESMVKDAEETTKGVVDVDLYE